MFSRRLVDITYVAVVARAIAATATTVSKRLLRTGVIARLFNKNLLRGFLITSPHKKIFRAT